MIKNKTYDPTLICWKFIKCTCMHKSFTNVSKETSIGHKTHGMLIHKITFISILYVNF